MKTSGSSCRRYRLGRELGHRVGPVAGARYRQGGGLPPPMPSSGRIGILRTKKRTPEGSERCRKRSSLTWHALMRLTSK
jgi:hypothetical protein